LKKINPRRFARDQLESARAAQILGVKVTTLNAKMKRYESTPNLSAVFSRANKWEVRVKKLCCKNTTANGKRLDPDV
jgi:hypothetical protein